MWECRGFADLLPLDVEVDQVLGDLDTATDVQPEEARAIAHAVPRRQTEFLTTRECARRALLRLGFAPQAIPIGAHREPIWPTGVVGSLTHSADLRAATVAASSLYRSLGIDAEANVPLPQSTFELIANPCEVSDVESLGSAWPRVAWDRLLFSAKEAVFKAWFPATGCWLDFSECTLSINAETSTFTARLHLDNDPRAQFGIEIIRGRWGVSRSHLLTAVSLPALPGQ